MLRKRPARQQPRLRLLPPGNTVLARGTIPRESPAPLRSTTSNGGDLEAKLWTAADKLRGHMDAAEYKHVVLGLIFLKYISDAFEEHYEQLRLWTADPQNETWYVAEPAVRYQVLEDRDEYTAENIFWVPKEARWPHLQANAKQSAIGQIVDDAMVAIEAANPSLKGVLPKDYARPTLNKQLLGELIDLVGAIGLGDAESKSKDILGRVYEYFLGRFAEAEGKRGGQFYTPQPVVRLLVEMLEPYKGRIYDPCCGSGGMFVSSEKFVEAHGGSRFALSHLRAGIESHHLEAVQDESGHSGHRGRHRPQQRRHLSERPAQRPAGRFHPRQSPIQHEGMGRAATAKGCALAIRRAAEQ